jgi:hypothetical protein
MRHRVTSVTPLQINPNSVKGLFTAHAKKKAILENDEDRLVSSPAQGSRRSYAERYFSMIAVYHIEERNDALY